MKGKMKMKNDTRGYEKGGGIAKAPGQSTGMGHKASQKTPPKGSYSPASYGNVGAGSDVKLKPAKIERQGPCTLSSMM